MALQLNIKKNNFHLTGLGDRGFVQPLHLLDRDAVKSDKIAYYRCLRYHEIAASAYLSTRGAKCPISRRLRACAKSFVSVALSAQDVALSRLPAVAQLGSCASATAAVVSMAAGAG